jgi:hypothetical protein
VKRELNHGEHREHGERKRKKEKEDGYFKQDSSREP